MTYNFIIVLYWMIFEEEPPYMSHQAMEAVEELADWFASLDDTYLKVFRC